MFSKKPETRLPVPASHPVASAATFSVIGADVTIKGDVEATADLHIDGTIEGDIVCTSLVQGSASRIEGSIRADGARIAGTLVGTVTVRELVVLKTARIDGDVHYETLTIEQGATVNGRFAPDGGAAGASRAGPPESHGERSGAPVREVPRGDEEPLKYAS